MADLLEAADLESGERVLDLADGTDVVAQAVIGRVPEGAACVVDAGALEGHAVRLPYPDASFDVALSLHTLEAFADRGLVLAELRRVLVPAGRLALAVWGPLDGNPAFAALADSLRRRAGVGAAAAVDWLFSLSHPADVRALLATAGFDGIRMRRTWRTIPASSSDQLLRSLRRTFPIGAATRELSPKDREAIVADLNDNLGTRTIARGLPFATDVFAALVGTHGTGDLR